MVIRGNMRVIKVIKILVAGIFGFLIAKILDDIANYIQRKDVNKQSVFLAMVIGVTICFWCIIFLILWGMPIVKKIILRF